jgi:hypothetical protein
MEKQLVIALYNNGALETPGAQTYGDVLQRCQMVTQIAEQLTRQIMSTPLPQPKSEPADVNPGE